MKTKKVKYVGKPKASASSPLLPPLSMLAQGKAELKNAKEVLLERFIKDFPEVMRLVYETRLQFQSIDGGYVKISTGESYRSDGIVALFSYDHIWSMTYKSGPKSKRITQPDPHQVMLYLIKYFKL